MYWAQLSNRLPCYQDITLRDLQELMESKLIACAIFWHLVLRSIASVSSKELHISSWTKASCKSANHWISTVENSNVTTTPYMNTKTICKDINGIFTAKWTTKLAPKVLQVIQIFYWAKWFTRLPALNPLYNQYSQETLCSHFLNQNILAYSISAVSFHMLSKKVKNFSTTLYEVITPVILYIAVYSALDFMYGWKYLINYIILYQIFLFTRSLD